MSETCQPSLQKGLKQSCKTFILELNKNRVNYITGAQFYLTVQSERMSNGYVIDINYIYMYLHFLTETCCNS